MNLQEAMTYKLCKLYLKIDECGVKARTKQVFYAIYSKSFTEFDADDIQMVKPQMIDDDGNPTSTTFFNGKVLSVNWNDDETLVKKEDGMTWETVVTNQYHNWTQTYLTIPDKCFKEETFVIICFKHAQSRGKGINGVDFDQSIIITLKDWKRIKKAMQKKTM